jgi:PAS domain-containing protein
MVVRVWPRAKCPDIPDTGQLKNVEEMLGKIIDGSPIPSFAIDTQHRVTHWNRALEAMSNTRRQDIIGTEQQWRAFYSEKTTGDGRPHCFRRRRGRN